MYRFIFRKRLLPMSARVSQNKGRLPIILDAFLEFMIETEKLSNSVTASGKSHSTSKLVVVILWGSKVTLSGLRGTVLNNSVVDSNGQSSDVVSLLEWNK